MVAHLLRLKLTLLRNSVRRSPWQLVGLGIGALYALGIVGLFVAGLLYLRGQEIELAQTVVVLGGAAALLGWAIIPVAVSAADMTLDPARFTTFAVPMPQLLAGLALGGLIGIPGLATTLVALATVGTWSRSVPAAAGALVGAVLGVLSCVVLSKVVTTATAGLASSRRFKDISAVAFLIPLVLTGPIVAGIAKGISGSGDFPAALARTLSWTPAGAAFALGGELAAGNYAAAAVKFLIAAATLGGTRPGLEGPVAAGPGDPALRGNVQAPVRRRRPVRGVPCDAGRGRRGEVPVLLAARSPLRRRARGGSAPARAVPVPGQPERVLWPVPVCGAADGLPAGLVHLHGRLL